MALLFLFFDVVPLTPLATPSALAGGVLHPAVHEVDAGLMARVASWVGTGFRLLTYTVLHFGTFALLGVAASFLLGNLGWAGSLVGGTLFGLTAWTGVYTLGRSLLDTPVVTEVIALPSLLVANGLSGVLLGVGVYVGRQPDADDGVSA